MSAWWVLAGVVAAGPLWLAVAWAWCYYRRHRPDEQADASGASLAELAQLAGGLAHEIKNPLSTINVNLKLLSEDLAGFEDDQHRRLRRRLGNVLDEADRLRGILDDFLAFAGRHELSLSEVDLRPLVDELADFFAPQAESAHILMRTDLPDEPVTCRVDPPLIKQAVLNLMINALQAMEAGGELMVRLGVRDRWAHLHVIDTGRGISDEEREKIFQAYYSTKSGGTGLGLPTTRRIVLEHGGRLEVDSHVGRGTCFTIALPLARE